jgi:hypothetical protein
MKHARVDREGRYSGKSSPESSYATMLKVRGIIIQGEHYVSASAILKTSHGSSLMGKGEFYQGISKRP